MAGALLLGCTGTTLAAPCAGFTDVDDTSPFCGNVTFLRNRGITLGCNQAGTLYCPGDPVSRLAMAAFMNRLADSLFPLNCAPGQIMKWNGAAWTCSDDVVGGGGGGGTVTSVLAGTGLQGSPNPITGAGSINIAPAFQLPQGCGNGEVAKSNGAGGWTCQTDAVGGSGTVTQVNTGTGLTGGPITSTGTVSIAAGGVGATQLASNAVTTAKIVDGAVTAAKIAPGAIDTGSLAPGVAAARPTYIERDIDATGTGQFVSIVVGVDGLPLIAYYAQSSGDLKVAHCETVDCASSTITTLDAAGDVGQYPSALVQRNGLVAIAYYDVTNTALKIAFCTDVPCTSATFATIDNTNDVGKYASLASGRLGGLDVSYFDETLDNVKFARCNQAPCNANVVWTVAPAVTTGSVGRGLALTMLYDETPLIAYFDATLGAVRLAYCNNPNCDAPALLTIHTLAAGRVAEGLAITLNQSGAPVVTFIDRTAGGAGIMRILVCDSPACAAPVVRSGGATNIEVFSTAVTVPFDNRPIALGAGSVDSQNCEAIGGGGGASGTLRKCLDEQCAATASQSPSLAGGGAVALNSTGFPIFAWRRCGTTGSRLAILSCSTATCLGHIRPR